MESSLCSPVEISCPEYLVLFAEDLSFTVVAAMMSCSCGKLYLQLPV